MRVGPSRGARLSAGLTAAALTVLVPITALAAVSTPRPVGPARLATGVTPGDPFFAPLAPFFGNFGMNATQMAMVAGGATPDPAGDFFTPTSPTTSLHPGGSDIRLTTYVDVKASLAQITAWTSPGGFLAPGAPGIITTLKPAQATPTGELDIYCTSLAEPPVSTATSQVEFGLAGLGFSPVNPNLHPVIYQPPRNQPFNFLNNSNIVWVSRGVGGLPYRLHLLVYDGQARNWVEGQTGAIGWMSGNVGCTVIPGAEGDAVGPHRAFADTETASNGSTQIASDSAPDITKPPLLPGNPPTVVIDVSGTAPVVTPEVTAPPTEAPSLSPGTSVTETGPASEPPSGESPAATPGGETPGPTANSGNDATPFVVILVVLIALILLGWLLIGRRKRGDPCEELLKALAEAQAACDEATRAAEEAGDASAAAQDRLAKARAALADAQKKLAAAQATLAARQQAPDQGAELGSTSFGGKDTHVSQYDLYLKDQARAAANDAWEAAKQAASSDADREAAHEQWVEELQKIDGPDGLDYVRSKAQTTQEQWIKDAEDQVKSAQAAVDAAQSTVNDAEAAAKDAADKAAAAKQRSDEACAKAAAAEEAAIDAGCITPKNSEPTQPEAPKPGDPRPTPPDPEPPKPDQDGPKTPTPATPPPPPPKKPPTDPPPPAPGNNCDGYDEKWVVEGPSADFTVPIPGRKIEFSMEPIHSQPLWDWISNFNGLDGDGKQGTDGAATAGVPPLIFERQTVDDWNRMFGPVSGANAKGRVYEFSITLPLETVHVYCERRYVCENGAWRRTSETHAVQDDPVPVEPPRSFGGKLTAPLANEFIRIAVRAQGAYKNAKQAAQDLANFNQRCQAGK